MQNDLREEKKVRLAVHDAHGNTSGTTDRDHELINAA
jgi:hypothetical protein